MHTSPTATIVPPNVTADMLTALVQQHPASEARINRGAALVRANHVESTTTAGVVLVRSASTDNRAYRVDAYACGCMDHTSREIFCQHQAARALWLAAMRAETDAEEAAMLPPTAAEYGGYLDGLNTNPLHPPILPEAQREYLAGYADALLDLYHSRPSNPPQPPCGCFCHVGLRVRCTCGTDGCPEQATDPDAPITMELTGRAYLTLIRPTALPPVAPAIQRVPVVLRGRALVAAQELYGDDYSGDAA